MPVVGRKGKIGSLTLGLMAPIHGSRGVLHHHAGLQAHRHQGVTGVDHDGPHQHPATARDPQHPAPRNLRAPRCAPKAAPNCWRDHPRQPGSGFWVDQSVDADGSPRARIRYGEAGFTLLAGMRAAVNALLATGNNVIIDEMPVDESIVPAWRRELRATSSLWVRLTASLPTLEQRERSRTQGQQLGNARGHLNVPVGDRWDLVLDTDHLSPTQSAARILKELGL